MALTQQTSSAVVTSGEIKFSELRRQFKTISPRTTYGGSEDFSGDSDAISISASELLRSTDTSVTDPVVGDSTENASIATANDWKTSQLRNSVKYYFAQQTGTNTDIDGDTDVTWNSNLGKTIKKIFFVEGTIGATSTAAGALEFSSSVSNLNVTLQSGSQIRGAGGSGGTSTEKQGKVGGNALSFTSTATGIDVNVKTGAQLKSGGGGGGFGGNGNYTSQGSGFGTFGSNRQTYQHVGGGFFNLVNDGGASSCHGASNKPAGYGYGGCASYSGAGGPSYRNPPGAPWATCTVCTYSYYVYNSAAVSAGTDGGLGEGHQQSRTSGAQGSNNAGAGGFGGVYGSPGDVGSSGTDGNGIGLDVTGSPGGLAGFALLAPADSYTLTQDGTVLGRKS